MSKKEFIETLIAGLFVAILPLILLQILKLLLC